jgi:hypothetical protein
VSAGSVLELQQRTSCEVAGREDRLVAECDDSELGDCMMLEHAASDGDLTMEGSGRAVSTAGSSEDSTVGLTSSIVSASPAWVVSSFVCFGHQSNHLCRLKCLR